MGARLPNCFALMNSRRHNQENLLLILRCNSLTSNLLISGKWLANKTVTVYIQN